VGSVWVLVRTLRHLEADKTVLKAVAAELRKPVPVVRTRIKHAALATLPAGGGLNAWVAATRITAAVELKGRAAGLRMRGGRRSVSDLRGHTHSSQSDIRAIDRGRVRHPSWGRRFRGQWFTQTVPEGFFTKTAAEAPEWDAAIQAGMDKAVSTVHA